MTMTYKELLAKHNLTPEIPDGVGKGWVPLVDMLIQNLKAAGWDGQSVQIKQKFGGLRFYIGKGTEQMRALIHQAENDSFKICEACGGDGARNGEDYIQTLCTDCRKLMKEARQKSDYKAMDKLFSGEDR